MELWTVLTLGLSLGAVHATDADHVAAVSTLLRGRGGFLRAARTGAVWGLGHSLTVLLAGGAMVAFRVAVPNVVSQGLELCVAAMLVLLGIRAMRSTRKTGSHAHPGAEAGAPGARSDTFRSELASFTVGVVHGLAGSAAVALAVLTQVRSTPVALSYLATFGVGTILGMGLVTALFSLPLAAREGVSRRLRWAAGAASIAVGFMQAYTFGSALIAA